MTLSKQGARESYSFLALLKHFFDTHSNRSNSDTDQSRKYQENTSLLFILLSYRQQSFTRCVGERQAIIAHIGEANEQKLRQSILRQSGVAGHSLDGGNAPQSLPASHGCRGGEATVDERSAQVGVLGGASRESASDSRRRGGERERIGEDADAGAEFLLLQATGGGVAAAGDQRCARTDEGGARDPGDPVGVVKGDERKVLEGWNGG